MRKGGWRPASIACAKDAARKLKEEQEKREAMEAKLQEWQESLSEGPLRRTAHDLALPLMAWRILPA